MVIFDVGARYKFDSRIFTVTFPATCDCAKCSSLCCEAGVLIDGEERDKIVSIKDGLLPLLLPDRKSPENWFCEPDEADLTRGSEKPFTPGDEEGVFATGTGEGYCNFYNPSFGCALQELAKRQGRQAWAFKPLACILYPLFVEDGVIAPDTTLDDGLWCSKKENHTSTVFRACLTELEHIVGKGAVGKLKALGKDYLPDKPRVEPDGRLRII